MSATTENKKITIDTSWQAQKRTERFEFRCSKNFEIVVSALIDKYAKEHRGLTKADLMVLAIKELANKEKMLKAGDDYYV